MMPTYRVKWTIDVEAEDPRAAAAEAQRKQQANREDYWAGCFDVTEHDTTNTVRVDLNDEADDEEPGTRLPTPQYVAAYLRLDGPIQRLILPIGALVHVLHDNLGTDQYDEEAHMPAGSIARVDGTWRGDDGKISRVALLYPNGASGTWDGDEISALAYVNDALLLAEAQQAFGRYDASEEPTPPFPTPLLDAKLAKMHAAYSNDRRA